MARSKKSQLTSPTIKAEARDRKQRAGKRMKVSGKGVLILGRLISQASKSGKKNNHYGLHGHRQLY